MKSRTSLPPRPQRGRPSRGFTLVELMVGLLLGLLTTLVISEVVAMSEGKRRTISMGGDAQVNGALALYTLQRDIQMSGYGAVANPAALGCAIKGEFKDPAAPADQPAISFTPTLAPVVIENGANGAPDKIAILQSRKPNFSAPMTITANHPQTGNVFTVESTLGATAGDLMIAVPGDGWDSDNWCTVFEVTSDGASPATDTTLSNTHVPHVSGTSNWNRSTVFPAKGYPPKSYLLNLGSMAHNSYEIDAAHNLVITARTAGAASTAPAVLYPQIVNLQAMYGKDTNKDGKIDAYNTVVPASADEWQQVIGIRLALVARSNQYEKDEVTTSEPVWDVGSDSNVEGAATCGNSKCLTLGVSSLPDWKHYRYKVYDTVVPLRNVLWNNAGT